jgi:hypothetical protein
MDRRNLIARGIYPHAELGGNVRAILNTSIVLILFYSSLATAYNIDLIGARPFLSATHRWNERWDVNLFYAETINLSDSHSHGVSYPSRDIQSYFQGGFVYRYTPSINFSAGYVFQRNNPFSGDFLNENRLWQQVVFSQPVGNGNLSHRVRLEERFIEDRARHGTQPMSTRVRYQISYTSPFVGREIVAKSFFFSFYNEFYFSTSKPRNTFYSENWSYGGVGYQTASYGRYEFGPLLQWATIDNAHDTRTFVVTQLGCSFNF